MADAEGNILYPPGFSTKSIYKPTEILASYAKFTQRGVTLKSGNGLLLAGTVLARDSVSKKYVPYADVSANEVQTLNLGAASGGTFTITFDGQTTAAIAYNASNSTVQAALEALSNIQTNEVIVTGGPLPATNILLTFSGGFKARTDVPQITVGTGSLTGGAATIATQTAGSSGTTASTGTALGILRHDVDVTSSDKLGNIIISGIVKYSAVIGLDTDALNDLNGRIDSANDLFSF